MLRQFGREIPFGKIHPYARLTLKLFVGYYNATRNRLITFFNPNLDI